MGWHKAVLVLGVALLLSGCELLPQATPTATPVPTATPTPTPLYWPTYADFDLVANQKFEGPTYGVTHGYYPMFAAIYAARACVAGNPLTPEGFMSFVDQTLFVQAAADGLWGKAGTSLEAVMAREVVAKLIALSDKDVHGSCIEPYLYPKTGAEASLGQALIMSEVRRQYGGLFLSRFGGLTGSALARDAAEWFKQDAQSRKPFVLWLWDREQLGPLPPQFPSSVPVPRGSAWTPTWAFEFQLGIEQARSREAKI